MNQIERYNSNLESNRHYIPLNTLHGGSTLCSPTAYVVLRYESCTLCL